MFPNVEYIKTLVNGLKEFINTKIKSVRKDIDELPQPDWNQNDPTAKDYVKNRTHWTAVEEVGGNGGSAFIKGSFVGNNPSLTFSTIRGLGQVYHNIPVISEGRYLKATVGEYTFSYDQYLGYVSVSPNTASVTDFDFFYKKEVSHPIPDEYIPDWVADKDSVPDPQVQADWYETDTTSKAYIRGKPTIPRYILNGTVPVGSYTNVPDSDGCVAICVGKGFTNLPAIVYAEIVNNRKPVKAFIYEEISSRINTIKGSYVMQDIYSVATRLPITEDEVPDGWIILMVYKKYGYDQYYFVCMNPRPKDYFASTDALPQHTMSADPTEDMQIATKKYVDDNTPAQTIQKIESTDQSNMVSIRSIDSGTYILYGYFKPYVGADSTMTFSANLLVNILKGDTESHVQVFYPYNNCVQYLKITDSSYERKDIYLNNLASKSDDVIINSSTEGSNKKFKIAVDDTGSITVTEVTE